MTTIAESGCKIQVIFAVFKRFGDIHTADRYRPDGSQAGNSGYITFKDYENLRGRAIVVDHKMTKTLRSKTSVEDF